jgi:hypothetical protein
MRTNGEGQQGQPDFFRSSRHSRDLAERIYVNSFLIVIWVAVFLALLYGAFRFVKSML